MFLGQYKNLANMWTSLSEGTKMELFKPTLYKHEVPLVFRESHVSTGFRRLHQPWRYYLASIFQRHNECMNTWTHLIAFIIVALRLHDYSHRYDLIGDMYMWPLLSSMIAMLLLYMCSAGAHCLHSRSELVHYTCFMVDYAGIGLYGLGGTQLHYGFCVEPSFFSIMKNIYLPVGVVFAVMTCVCCSVAQVMYQQPYPFARRIWQLTPTASMYIWAMLPILHRIPGSWAAGIPDHVQSLLWFTLAGFFFGSDIPQRFYPGKFDMFGHSHQWFHFCVMMTSIKQLDAFVLDYNHYRDQIYARPSPTFLSTIGAVIIVFTTNIVIATYFTLYIKRTIEKERVKTNGAATQNGFHENHTKCH